MCHGARRHPEVIFLGDGGLEDGQEHKRPPDQIGPRGQKARPTSTAGPAPPLSLRPQFGSCDFERNNENVGRVSKLATRQKHSFFKVGVSLLFSTAERLI